MKAFFQLIVFVALFVGVWLGLSAIDWMRLLKVKERVSTTESKLGEVIWTSYSAGETEIKDTKANESLRKMVDHLCVANNIDTAEIKTHIIKKDQVNAFTLPNGHIVIFTGLIDACENESELIGVLGHEMGHSQKGHVMKKMVHEVGLSVLVAIASGKGGGEAARRLLKLLTSTAFDRSMEKKADMASVSYMIKAKVNPEPFAEFLFRLGDATKDVPSQVEWISTHPESKERSKYILDYCATRPHPSQPLLTAAEWEQMKREAGDTNDQDDQQPTDK